MTNKNTCCVKCEKHVRDRSFIGSGSSLKSMTGIHCECKNPSCPCHKENMPESWEREFREKYSIKVTANNTEDDTKAFLLERYWQHYPLGEMVEDITSLLAQERAKAVSEVLGTFKHHFNGFGGTLGFDLREIERIVEARSRGEINEKEV